MLTFTVQGKLEKYLRKKVKEFSYFPFCFKKQEAASELRLSE